MAKPFPGSIDPIEKKPLFHFYPGEKIFSIGTVGCNFKCQNCQNYEMSQAKYDDYYPIPDVPPKNLVHQAKTYDCNMIAYTYNEPTVFYEYMLETSKIARENNVKNVMVSNGYIENEPLLELCKYIDAANIDLKSLDDEFYKEICKGTLDPVLRTIKTLKEKNVWLELTTLIIPKLSDNKKMIEMLCTWVHENLGDNTPIHFSAFSPKYELMHLDPTPKSKLVECQTIAKKVGLKYVYIGNASIIDGETTFCTKCQNKVIIRNGYDIIKMDLSAGKCKKCNLPIPGHFSLN
jgi:pyruvate formate lyase activating enzyme